MFVRPEDYSELLEGFFGGLRYRLFIAPYPRWTTLHRFVEQALYGILEESVDDIMVDAIAHIPDYEPLISEALEEHGLQHPHPRDWLSTGSYRLDEVDEDVVYRYRDHLTKLGTLGSLATQLAEEVFFITFLNRDLLRRLHEEIAERVRDVDPVHEAPQDASHFERKGVLHRVSAPNLKVLLPPNMHIRAFLCIAGEGRILRPEAEVSRTARASNQWGRLPTAWFSAS